MDNYYIQNEEFLTVTEVLDIFNENGGYKFLAGKNGQSNICKYMIILETPNGVEWLTGNEFLLSSGYALNHDTESLIEIVRKAKGKKVSAIAIKENRYLPYIPHEMIEEAEKLDLPLILIPSNIVYTKIHSCFYEKLFNKKYKSLIYEKNIDNILFSLVFDQRKTNDVIIALSGLLQVSIAIFDHTNLEISSCYLDGENHNDVMGVFSERIYEDNINQFIIEDQITNESIQATVFKLNKQGKYFYAYEWSLKYLRNPKTLRVISSNPLDTAQFKALDYGSMIISLKMYDEEKIVVRKIKLKRTITELMLNQKDLGKNFYSNFEEDFCLNSNWKGYGLVISSRSKIWVNDQGADIKYFIIDAIDFLCGDKEYLITERDNNFFLFCGFDGKKKVKELIERLRFYIHNNLKYSHKIVIGISRPYPSIKDIPSMYQDCFATTLFTKEHNEIFYEDLDIEKFLLTLISDREFIKYYYQTIGVLEEYDQQNDSNYVETLICFIKNDLNKPLAAAKLFIHPETLRYRLKRIEELTGRSLKTSEGQLILQLAARCYDHI